METRCSRNGQSCVGQLWCFSYNFSVEMNFAILFSEMERSDHKLANHTNFMGWRYVNKYLCLSQKDFRPKMQNLSFAIKIELATSKLLSCRIFYTSIRFQPAGTMGAAIEGGVSFLPRFVRMVKQIPKKYLQNGWFFRLVLDRFKMWRKWTKWLFLGQ